MALLPSSTARWRWITWSRAGPVALLGNGCICSVREDTSRPWPISPRVTRADSTVPRVLVRPPGSRCRCSRCDGARCRRLLPDRRREFATVDAVNGAHPCSAWRAVRQIAVADRLLVTKTDRSRYALRGSGRVLPRQCGCVIACGTGPSGRGAFDAGLFRSGGPLRRRNCAGSTWHREANAPRSAGTICDGGAAITAEAHDASVSSTALIIDERRRGRWRAGSTMRGARARTRCASGDRACRTRRMHLSWCMACSTCSIRRSVAADRQPNRRSRLVFIVRGIPRIIENTCANSRR